MNEYLPEWKVYLWKKLLLNREEFDKGTVSVHAFMFFSDEEQYQLMQSANQRAIGGAQQTYGLAVARRKAAQIDAAGQQSVGGMFLEEVEKDGERVLAFSNNRIKQTFIEAKDSLVEGYASLLAFNQMFERLSKIYEIGLTYKTAMWLAVLGRYIDDHNEALRIASGERPEKDAKLFTRLRPVLKVDPAFWIDRAKIKPKSVISKRYLEEFEKIFGVGFET